MLRTIEDFQKNWAYEAESTTKILRLLTDQSLSQKVYNTGRELGFLAWHLATTPGEMLGLTGLKIEGPGHSETCPQQAAIIAEAYELTAKSVSEVVAAEWTDETLLETDSMYGDTWARGLTLFYLITHQAHHRGQVTVLMRQAGLPVPGVYGPSKEEWAAHGAPAMA